jgi:hypothetical protein
MTRHVFARQVSECLGTSRFDLDRSWIDAPAGVAQRGDRLSPSVSEPKNWVHTKRVPPQSAVEAVYDGPGLTARGRNTNRQPGDLVVLV